MAKKPGRPRVAIEWASMLRRVLFVSYQDNPAVHTALHMAGTEAQELLIAAVSEYLVNHDHPARYAACQQQVAMAGLGMGSMPHELDGVLSTKKAQTAMHSQQADLCDGMPKPEPELIRVPGPVSVPAHAEHRQEIAQPVLIRPEPNPSGNDFLSDALDDC